MKLALVLALMFVAIPFSANATEEVASSESVASLQVPVVTTNLNNPIANDRWYFLGCVDSEHACADSAGHEGFHHYYTRHHDSRCHHDHHENGCYGRN